MTSDMRNALSIQKLGKSYILAHRAQGVGKYQKLSDLLVQRAKSLICGSWRGGQGVPTTRETFWALDDVSFDIRQGERVGVIGRNGAGKSTLLKVISRITAPTRGRVEITGRVSSLLEVGTGFHPELTGRENIFLNGAVLGMTRHDIYRRFDEIVQFAEVERFLDMPVKHYSSGMYMRLAFSVAAHLEPDILIVDEVLAVGDAAFQKKCLGKMKEVGGEGRTVLFVSHNMGAISEFCSRAILLDQGLVAADGTPAEIVPIYSGGTARGNHSGIFEYPDSGSGPCHIQRVCLLGSEGNASNVFEMSDSVSVQIDYVARAQILELQLTVTVIKDGVELFHAFDNDDDADIAPTQPGLWRATYRIPRRILKEGLYALRVTAGLPTELLQDIDRDVVFEVINHSVSVLKKSYRSDRAGLIASPGAWLKQERTNGSSDGGQDE